MRLPEVVSTRTLTVFRRAKLLVLNSSRRELGLSETQGLSIDRLLVDWSGRQNKIRQNGTFNDGESRRQKSEDLSKDNKLTLQAIAEILTPEQQTRLNQLVLQQLGFMAFFGEPDPALADFVLNDNQAAEVRKMRTRRRESKAKLHEEFLTLLEPDQRVRWDELIGKPFLKMDSISRRVVTFPSLRSPASSLRRDAIQRNLNLSEEQLDKIRTSIAMWKKQQFLATEQMLAGAVGEEWDTLMAELKQSADATSNQLSDTLTPDQSDRLDELLLQLSGVHALARPEVSEALALDRRQRQRVAEIRQSIVQQYEESRKAGEGSGTTETPEQIRQRYLKQGLEVLTTAQRKQWDAMVGELVEFNESERQGG